jgi:hypothetical protein
MRTPRSTILRSCAAAAVCAFCACVVVVCTKTMQWTDGRSSPIAKLLRTSLSFTTDKRQQQATPFNPTPLEQMGPLKQIQLLLKLTRFQGRRIRWEEEEEGDIFYFDFRCSQRRFLCFYGRHVRMMSSQPVRLTKIPLLACPYPSLSSFHPSD